MLSKRTSAALRRLRLALALFALLAVALAAIGAASSTWGEARGAWKRGHRFRHLTYEMAEERLFGADYVRALRAIRGRVPEDATVLLVDAQSREGGACFFALHYLAPRRVEKLRQKSGSAARRRLRRLAETSAWVVIVPDFPQPLRLVTARELLDELRRDR